MAERGIEVMAPAGSWESLHAAIKAGADSVYFGLKQLNMRSLGANNFKLSHLKKVVSICKENRVKSYLTVNSLIYDKDLKLMKRICDAAKKADVSAIIAFDISVIEYARSIGLQVHMSTQSNISNIEAVRFYSRYADAVILARELSLEQIRKICQEINEQEIKGPGGGLIRVELFVHGALCVSIAGKCYMSLATYNRSANRGACLQNCRRAYRVIDDETGDELLIENKYVMSPKDLCTINYLDQLLDAGVSILKIEGRARSPEYVYEVTRDYKEAAQAYMEGAFTKEKARAWEKRLKQVFNRGFWQGGYYLGKKLGEWSGVYGSKATKKKIQIGKALNYFQKKNIGYFQIETGNIKVGDDIFITGPTTGFLKKKVTSMFIDNKPVNIAKKGQKVTIQIDEKVRKNDKLFKIEEIIKR